MDKFVDSVKLCQVEKRREVVTKVCLWCGWLGWRVGVGVCVCGEGSGVWGIQKLF